MGDDITIGVTEIVNNIEITAQPNDQIVDISVIDNADEVTLNITPTVVEINVNRGSSYARWGTIYGNLTDQTDLANALILKADLIDGKVPSYQLPSYVDDVIEVANYAALPVAGETGKLYVTLDTNRIYRWTGSTYVEITDNTAVWGAITGTLSSQTDLQNALNLKADKTITITPNSPLSGGGDLSANRTLSISQAGASSDGYLSSTDWNTFNNKQNQLNGTGFVKATGTTISYDNTSYLPLSGGTMTGNLFLRENSTVGGTNYFIGQAMASNDSWKIYGNTIESDKGELVFEIGDNAIPISGSNGQRFRFYYDNSSNGTAKSPFILDYNEATFDANVTATSFIKSGGTSSQFLKADGSVASNVITGSGTTNYVPYFTSSGVLGGTPIIYNGTNIFVNSGLSVGSSPPATPTNGLSVQGNIITYGNVGIGTTSPSYRLQVKGNGFAVQGDNLNEGNSIRFLRASGTEMGYIGWSNESTNNSTWLFKSSNGNPIGFSADGTNQNMVINTNGNVGIGTLGTGLVYSSGGTLTSTNPSDRRLKEEITDLPYGLNEIIQLRPVTYLWKNDTINQGKQFGFIAQEVQEVMPELVKEFETKDGEEDVIRLGLDKEAIFVAMVNAIKELKAEIELLKAK